MRQHRGCIRLGPGCYHDGVEGLPVAGRPRGAGQAQFLALRTDAVALDSRTKGKMPDLKLTWLGHSTFLMDSPGGKRILVDPWTLNNPACPEAFKHLDRLDLMLISHGHFDHISDAVEIARETGCQVVCIHETSLWLMGQGVKNVVGMNKGGNIPVLAGSSDGQRGIKVRMVDARHSCGIQDGDQIVYGGEAAGFVVTFEDQTKVYHSGDTALFGDMALIGECYAPDIALLPIGDLYTMDPADAARAVQMLGVRQVIPMHHSTFDALPGRPADFVRQVGSRARVVVLEPGQQHVFHKEAAVR